MICTLLSGNTPSRGSPRPPKKGFLGKWAQSKGIPLLRVPPETPKWGQIAKIPQIGAIRCNSPYCTYSMRYPIYGTLLPLLYYPVHVTYPSRWWYCTFLMIYHVFLTWSGHLDIWTSCHHVMMSIYHVIMSSWCHIWPILDVILHLFWMSISHNRYTISLAYTYSYSIYVYTCIHIPPLLLYSITYIHMYPYYPSILYYSTSTPCHIVPVLDVI